MSTTSPAVTPQLSVLDTVADPTAQYGTPADRVQVQNASPFTLQVSVGGQQFTIQSFTAQTLPTSSTGAGLTLVPTDGPTGAQGSITAVWLLDNEGPPMADGQLTGAAQYAQGLGELLTTFSYVGASGTNTVDFTIPVPPNVRTLIIACDTTLGGVVLNVKVGGPTLGGFAPWPLYNAHPYLVGQNTLTENEAVVIVPVPGNVGSVLGLSAEVTATGGGFGGSVYGDTAAYNESLFYTGYMESSETYLDGQTLVAGPARLFTLWCGGCQINHGNAVLSGSNTTLTFPPNTIIAPGDSLTQQGGGFAGVTYAYP